MSFIKTFFIDESAYQIENDNFIATILPTKGSNVISLYDKIKNVELLRTPHTKEEYNTRPMLYGTPVLFPPNRIEDATFSFNSRIYEFTMNRAKENNHIHGFVHDKEWQVLKSISTKNKLITQIKSKDYPEILQQFPHHFTIEMHVELTNVGLLQTIVVKNESSTTMPVGLGYHTTFSFPISTSTLQMNIEKQWCLNSRGLPTGKLKSAALQNDLIKGMNLKGIALDDIYPMTNIKEAIIIHPTLKTKITYRANNGFSQWVLFTAGGKDNLLAIEPYSWVTNAPNLNLPNEITGLQSLKTQETKAFVTEIIVEHM